MYLHRQNTRWQINKKGKVGIEPNPKVFTPLRPKSPSRGRGVTGCICNVHDLSLSGIKISLSRRLTRDTLLKLVFNIASKLEFVVSAWVAWHKILNGLNLYGLYFAKIAESDKEKISEFIRSNVAAQTIVQTKEYTNPEKGGENMEDKRIFERFPTNFPLRFINLRENKEGTAKTKDISAKGVGFLSKEDFKVHTPLEMWLEIPDRGEPLYARGEVVWSKMVADDAYQVGVSLDKADFMGMSRVLRT